MQKYSSDIEPRRLHFHFPQPIPKYWHGGSDIKTYHFNALAVFLPTLERLVVLSLKKSARQVSDTALKAQVASLIAQEAIHGSQFNLCCQQLVYENYQIDAKQYSMRFFRLLAGFFNKISNTFHCSLSASGEHFTMIAAEIFLSDPKWFKNVDSIYSAIWRWHCIEEIEHKSVAFDVYKTLNGSYFIRILGMILMTGVFSILYIKPIWHMMKQDNKHKDYKFYLRAFQYYWGKGGLCRAFFKPYIDYFKPHYHPTLRQNEHLIDEWKAFFNISSRSEILAGLELVTPPVSDKHSNFLKNSSSNS